LVSELAVIALIVVASGLIQGITGFGFGLFAMGALVLAVPVRDATVIVAIVTLGSALTNLGSVREHIDLREAAPVVLPSIPATIAGVLLIPYIPTATLKAGVAVMIIAGCAVTLFSPGDRILTRPRPAADLAGLIGGLFGGALNMGGPPVVLYTLLRGWDKTQSKAVMSVYFCATGVLRVALHVATGAATWPLIRLSLLLLVPAVLASYLGVRVFRRLSTQAFRYAATGLLIALAAKVLAG